MKREAASEHTSENDVPWTWCACGCGVRLPKEADPHVTVYASPNCYARAVRVRDADRDIPPGGFDA